VLALAFMANGVLHVTAADAYGAIVPPWVPAPHLTVLATGAASFLGGLGLLLAPVRRAAGIGLALYCAGVFPANIHHALANVAVNGHTLGWGYHGPRLLLQPPLAWACLWAACVIDWPFAKRRPSANP
jgi:uncharacterized membrane protein